VTAWWGVIRMRDKNSVPARMPPFWDVFIIHQRVGALFILLVAPSLASSRHVPEGCWASGVRAQVSTHAAVSAGEEGGIRARRQSEGAGPARSKQRGKAGQNSCV
jgi:hypothetical protein